LTHQLNIEDRNQKNSLRKKKLRKLSSPKKRKTRRRRRNNPKINRNDPLKKTFNIKKAIINTPISSNAENEESVDDLILQLKSASSSFRDIRETFRIGTTKRILNPDNKNDDPQ